MTSNICRIAQHIHHRLTMKKSESNNISIKNTSNDEIINFYQVDEKGNIRAFPMMTPLEKWGRQIDEFNCKRKFIRTFLPFGLALVHFAPSDIHKFN